MVNRNAEAELQLPPGFRFFPTDEELVVHYLCRKANLQTLPVPIIAEVDLYKYDPWQLPEKALFGEKEWYFFTPRDRKYPNGSRPNRAAGSGYWKATGADKPISTATKSGKKRVGIKKALVFYAGKAPKGTKTNWIMHEYRLADATRPARKKGSLRLDDWVLCRIYNKKNSSEKVTVEQIPRPTCVSPDNNGNYEPSRVCKTEPTAITALPSPSKSPPLNLNVGLPEEPVFPFGINTATLKSELEQPIAGFNAVPSSSQWPNYASTVNHSTILSGPHTDSSTSKHSSPDFVSEEVQSSFRWESMLHQQNHSQPSHFAFGMESLQNPLLHLEEITLPDYINSFTSSEYLPKLYSNDALFR